MWTGLVGASLLPEGGGGGEGSQQRFIRGGN